MDGYGVVGMPRRRLPGDRYEYTSWVPLPTPIGTMRGTFLMKRDDGTEFRAQVREFVLAEPGTLH